jgi:hypothetical protein
MKTKIILICALLGIALSSCQSSIHESTEATVSSKKLPTISMDSLRRLGDTITLWTEGKKTYETYHQVTLEEVGHSRCQFVADMTGTYEFEWAAVKDYMQWVGYRDQVEIFYHHPGEQFVVLGFYYNSPDGRTLHFTGDLYKTKKQKN